MKRTVLQLWMRYYEVVAHDALVAQDFDTYRDAQGVFDVLGEALAAVESPRIAGILGMGEAMARYRGDAPRVRAYESVRALVMAA